MWDWILQHSTVVQAMVGMVTALVWITYLHMFVAGMRRQRRTEILITLGGDRGLAGRIIISNLGLEPIYVLDVVLKIDAEGEESVVSVTDRAELHPSDRPSLDVATLQRPLKSGDHVEIGSIDDLLERASLRSERKRKDLDLTRIEITVAAVTAASSGIAAARRVFHVTNENNLLFLRSDKPWSEQIRNRHGRKAIIRQLSDTL
ncbi:hypothetical protein [Paracoccus siganidrum]|uniref:Uncharacterized protein n=1 Tax=Paracoccus siganidrum TaxID=1276757 RepID=A0A419AC34_9RHOB|nr:hypothetical protein [Paracoccus siganidrum]RJL21541.1 hypothetical protein D3P05_01340 [Paracoccus siganidrum]RMC30920.1 hypothetical protein C9E82_16855 [Paracoccus siganidrum]